MASSSFPSERQRNSHIHFIQQEREENVEPASEHNSLTPDITNRANIEIDENVNEPFDPVGRTEEGSQENITEGSSVQEREHSEPKSKPIDKSRQSFTSDSSSLTGPTQSLIQDSKPGNVTKGRKNSCSKGKICLVLAIALLVCIFAGSGGGLVVGYWQYTQLLSNSTSMSMGLTGEITLLFSSLAFKDQIVYVLVNVSASIDRKVNVYTSECNEYKTTTMNLPPQPYSGFSKNGEETPLNYLTGNLPLFLLPDSVLYYNMSISSISDITECVAQLFITEISTGSHSTYACIDVDGASETFVEIPITKDGFYTVTLIAYSRISFDCSISGSVIGYNEASLKNIGTLTPDRTMIEIPVQSENTCIYVKPERKQYENVLSEDISFSAKKRNRIIAYASIFAASSLLFVIGVVLSVLFCCVWLCCHRKRKVNTTV